METTKSTQTVYLVKAMNRAEIKVGYCDSDKLVTELNNLQEGNAKTLKLVYNFNVPDSTMGDIALKSMQAKFKSNMSEHGEGWFYDSTKLINEFKRYHKFLQTNYPDCLVA